jgi:hypothetical protein
VLVVETLAQVVVRAAVLLAVVWVLQAHLVQVAAGVLAAVAVVTVLKVVPHHKAEVEEEYSPAQAAVVVVTHLVLVT